MTNKTCSNRGALSYGIYRLDNPCLLSHLYPYDLPEDWRLEYYNNEFNVILTTLEELEVLIGLNRNSVIAMCSGISHIVDELHEHFILLIELTPDIHDTFTIDELEQIKNLSMTTENLHFVRDTELSSQINEMSNALFSLFQLENLFARENVAQKNVVLKSIVKDSIIRNSFVKERSSCLMIKEKAQLTPLVLRQLLEYCFQLADKKDELWVLFSSEEYALDNCKNAILMDSLM
jgi:hypothetical protein